MTESKRSADGERPAEGGTGRRGLANDPAPGERDEFFSMLMQVPAAILVRTGADLTCVFQNEASLQILDQRGQPLRASWPDAPRDWFASYKRAIRGETLVVREVAAARAWPTGETTRYWDVTYAPVRRSDGTIEGVMTTAFEVTDRVHARRRTEYVEQLRRLAFEATGAGTWHMPLRARMVTRDAAFNQILGLPGAETVQPLDDFLGRVHPEDRANVAGTIERSIRAGADYQIEARIVRPDGTTRWLRDLGRVLRTPDGRPIALAGAAADITAYKRAEAQRAAARERLRIALEVCAIGTYVWDLRTDRVEHDEGVKRLFGFGADEGEPLDHYTARIVNEDRERWLAGLASSARDGRDFQEEYRVRWPDGSVHWILDKGRMLHDGRGAFTQMTGAIVDITDQKHLTEAAEDASRAKDEFLAMLGHELRNPLAPIVTAVELMKVRGEAASKERQIIERQVQHLNRLVDDLLDISRITRGAIELRREPLVLCDVIAKALEIASPLLEEKGHHVTLDVARSLQVVGDPVRLAQVFANLLTNAARYTPKAGHISVAAARDADRTIVRVTDDGIGIGPDMLGRIFDLFVQGRRGTARSEGGLGIGLALVKNLVRMHGGEVSAHSRGPGTGSEFVVKLPAEPDEQATAPTARAAPREGVRRRVLVVDDNVDAAQMLAELICELGHEIAVAHDGEEALAVVDQFRPEVAILDIGLPAMDGYELAAKIRARGFEDCRMIALTGYGQDQDHARSRAAGFDAHLVKPVEMTKLASLVTAT